MNKMKDLMTKQLAEKRTQVEKLESGLVDSESKEERAAIGATLATLRDEINEVEEALNSIEEESPIDDKEDKSEEGRNIMLKNLTRSEDTNNLEYRNAFKDLILKGTPIPKEMRADANTLTSDVTSVIPTELVNRIIEAMDDVGMIIPLVSRTAYAAGVTIPTSAAKPTASWVNEGASSERQKKTTSSIVFSYYKLRCEISMSMEVGTMALAAFEAKFVENVAKAMVKAIEEAIVSGDGSGKPTGILEYTPGTNKAIEVAANGALDYQLLCDVEAQVENAYESSAIWLMSKATFMKFIGMVDTAGQPIARINYGINGKADRTLLGRQVVVNPYVSNYADEVEADTIFAAIVDPQDYLLNTIYDMGITKKQDWDTEDLLTKAVMSVDGKLLSVDSLITLTKLAPEQVGA